MVKQIHFGWHVRAKRLEMQKSIRQFAQEVDLSEKRLIDIEKMPTPGGINESTYYGIARALGVSVEQLDRDWRSNPAPEPKLRANKTTTVRVPAGHTALIVTDEAVESLKAYAVKYKLPSAAAVVERFAKNILKGTIKEAVAEQPSPRAKGAAKHLPARQQDQARAQAQHDQ